MTHSLYKRISLLLVLVLLLTCVPSAYADEDGASADAAVPAGEAPSSDGNVMQPADSGIIDAEALNTWMDDYAALNGLDGEYQRFSVGFCYTGTGDCWFYRADDWMYSASLYKVPVSMLMAEKEAAGELSPDTEIANMYGGGTLERLESTALVLSNNDSGHIMVEYLGGTYNGKCADQTVRFTPLGESYFTEEDFANLSYYTARYMTYVMKTLFDGGDETFPHVEQYLKEAQPGEYYNTDPVLSGYGVAQKYGAFVEQNGNNNNHCAAIIYTPTPIIVVVMTRNVGDYQRRIGEVGAHLAEVALQLDEKQAALEQEALQREAEAQAEAEAEAALAEAAAAEPETLQPGPGGDGSANQQPGGDAGQVSSQNPPAASDTQREDSAGNGRGFPLWLPLAVLAILVLAVGTVAAVKASARRRRRTEKRRSAVRTDESDSTGYKPRH